MKIRNKRTVAVAVAPPGGDPFVVEAGDTVEVDDDLAKSLLAQPDRWAKSTPSKSDKES